MKTKLKVKGKKDKVVRISISSSLFQEIKKHGWHKEPAKESLKNALKVARKIDPNTKFNIDHHNWYLCKFRKQLSLKLGVDKLHVSKIPPKAPSSSKKKK